MNQFNTQLIQNRIREVAKSQAHLSDAVAYDVAFHMKDWLDDLEAFNRFCAEPGTLADEEVSKLESVRNPVIFSRERIFERRPTPTYRPKDLSGRRGGAFSRDLRSKRRI